MNDQQLLRYSRHIMLNEIDIVVQQRWLNAKVLVVGCGGLGNAVVPYLAAAGIGKIVLADHDKIEISNLQRQVCYKESDIGDYKAKVLAQVVNKQNSDVQTTTLIQRLELNELTKLIGDCDLVLDCSDNFSTRQAVNQAAVQTKTALVSGSAIGFNGQLLAFDANQADTPCYCCLFGKGAFADDLCATFGVFSPLVAMVGAAQACEALKSIGKICQLPLGILQQYDAINSTISKFEFTKNPSCEVCSLAVRNGKTVISILEPEQ